MAWISGPVRVVVAEDDVGYLLKERVGDVEAFEFGRAPTEHRRVLAVLAYLRGSAS